MSLDINQIALHQLIKRDEQNLELVLRDSLKGGHLDCGHVSRG